MLPFNVFILRTGSCIIHIFWVGYQVMKRKSDFVRQMLLYKPEQIFAESQFRKDTGKPNLFKYFIFQKSNYFTVFVQLSFFNLHHLCETGPDMCKHMRFFKQKSVIERWEIADPFKNSFF